MTLEAVQLRGHCNGAVEVNDGTVELQQCTLEQNEAVQGGALLVRGGTTSVSASLMRWNKALESGGAIQVIGVG